MIVAIVRDRVHPGLYDFFGRLTERELAGRRRKLLANARGRVLEIGAGTGFNIPHYPAELEFVVLTDPAAGMLARAERRASELRRPVTLVQARAESLPFEDGSFDTVVTALVLCSVDDVERALAEIRRVLRHGGQLAFLEHVRWDEPRRAKWQDRLERPWRALAGGCHPNRPTLQWIEAGPFDVIEVDRGELPKAPPIVRPIVVGRALAG